MPQRDQLYCGGITVEIGYRIRDQTAFADLGLKTRENPVDPKLIYHASRAFRCTPECTINRLPALTAHLRY